MPIGQTEAGSPHPGERTLPRAKVRGKFFFAGDDKLFVKGVTYGPFGPEGREFGSREIVERDFALMGRTGVNTIRTYTAPPRWLLDAAARHGLRVMVGLAWEQHVAFLEDPSLEREIEARVRRAVTRSAGHPAVFCYAVGNEIPAPIVRWHGRRRVEAFLERLARAVRSADPGVPVTYVNYPTTEYLRLPFLDFLSFNVFLEEERDLRAYVARLQTLAADRPLLLTELGLDASRHGEVGQARSLRWQVGTAFEGGAAGAVVFSWTDEWWRGGEEVREWSFGLTDRERNPRPALKAVRTAFTEAPFRRERRWPRVSVVVCTYNGSATLRECLEHTTRLRYPDYEVIVVDDGSTDGCGRIAEEFDVRLVRTPNQGLSSARNTGLHAATGEIVAYLDDDAFPDPDWLTYLAATFSESPHAAVGGPNIPPDDEGFVARCVARSPGGPLHVLVSDTEAEHVPGCNMAFRRDRLRAIGGFDPRFRVAGDDVDVCWRIRERGWTLGFAPGAVVWHRRRGSVRAYWRQQVGYGRAEALLERKWPEKYNAAGHVSWSGRLYAGGEWGLLSGFRTRIYQGTWGSAPFQRAEPGRPGPIDTMATVPETWLLVGALLGLGLLGITWRPLTALLPLAALAAAPLSVHALRLAWRSVPAHEEGDARQGLRARALTACLHLLQPLARLAGRVSSGLAPWRRHGEPVRAVEEGAEAVPASDLSFILSGDRRIVVWSERWRGSEQWLQGLERGLAGRGLVVRRGGEYDRWDLEARSGALGAVRALLAVEEHGSGRQLVRLRLRRRWASAALLAFCAGVVLSTAAALDGAWLAAGVLGTFTLLLGGRAVGDQRAAARAAGVIVDELRRTVESRPAVPFPLGRGAGGGPARNGGPGVERATGTGPVTASSLAGRGAAAGATEARSGTGKRPGARP